MRIYGEVFLGEACKMANHAKLVETGKLQRALFPDELLWNGWRPSILRVRLTNHKPLVWPVAWKFKQKTVLTIGFLHARLIHALSPKPAY